MRQWTRVRCLLLLVVVNAATCSSPTEPLPANYEGERIGTTDHGTAVAFTVSDHQVTSFTMTFHLSPTCSATENIVGPRPIVTLDPPGRPPYDQPGFVIGKTEQGRGVAANGVFSPDRRTVLGEIAIAAYPGCGTKIFDWTGRRR